MTSVQEWLMKGEAKGEITGEMRNKRKMVLRGKWKTAPADFLADQSELSLEEVNNLFKGYDAVYAAWRTNKHISPENVQTKHLTESEITYLLDLFNKYSV